MLFTNTLPSVLYEQKNAMGKPKPAAGTAPAAKFQKSVDPTIVHKHRPPSTNAAAKHTSKKTSTAVGRHSVQMPAAGAKLTALQLTADQKSVVKHGCQSLYGYKHTPTTGRAPPQPANLTAATSQLEELMQRAKERKAAAAAAATAAASASK